MLQLTWEVQLVFGDRRVRTAAPSATRVAHEEGFAGRDAITAIVSPSVIAIVVVIVEGAGCAFRGRWLRLSRERTE
jgi:hypothetical protein